MTKPKKIEIGVLTAELADFVMARVSPEPNSGCWLWTGRQTRDGYGKLRVRGRDCLAHRLAYELLRGPIPEGLVLDHKCCNRGCVNPDHLRPVTHRENILFGIGPTAVNARKSSCPLGHEYSWATYGGGRRICRACIAISERARSARKRAANA